LGYRIDCGRDSDRAPHPVEVRALRLIGTKYEYQGDIDDVRASAVLVKENRMCHRYAIFELWH
jgi:hypothetical protein